MTTSLLDLLGYGFTSPSSNVAMRVVRIGFLVSLLGVISSCACPAKTERDDVDVSDSAVLLLEPTTPDYFSLLGNSTTLAIETLGPPDGVTLQRLGSDNEEIREAWFGQVSVESSDGLIRRITHHGDGWTLSKR